MLPEYLRGDCKFMSGSNPHEIRESIMTLAPCRFFVKAGRRRAAQPSRAARLLSQAEFADVLPCKDPDSTLQRHG
jgi:hypothetical protein